MNNAEENKNKSLAPERAFFVKDLDGQIKKRAEKIQNEFVEAFYFLKKYPKSVTFFGSARLDENNPYYQKARILAGKLCKEGYAVITGGGGGIMEAGNKGSSEACNYAVGLNIELPMEQTLNQYATDSLKFHYFFSRKVALAFSAEAYVFFPGGFGTLDEFFEILTLVQTKKIPRLPIIAVGLDFWGKLNDFFVEVLLDKFETISREDLNLFIIEDDLDEIVKIIKSAPMRYEYE